MDDATYNLWLSYLFDRDESSGNWHFFDDEEFELFESKLDDKLILSLIKRTLDNYLIDIDHYSDWQIALGIEFIFNNSLSNYAFSITNNVVDLDMRMNVIKAMNTLFENCFAKRCNQVLGHLSEEGNPLNATCYMLWDATPITYNEGNPEKDTIYSTLADVMERSLYLSNIACVESGLHGLGHMTHYYPEAEKIIQNFINETKITDSRVLGYAEAAKTGCIN